MRNSATATPYRRTQILTANPSELMLLLYNAAMCFGEQAIAKMERELLSRGLVSHGDNVIVVGSMPVASRGLPNFVKLHRIK